MAIRKSIWFYPQTAPTFGASTAGSSNASNTFSVSLASDYINYTNTNVTTANAFNYRDMTSVTDYVIVAGDFLEYDIYWVSNLAKISIDLYTQSGYTLRDCTVAVDQNNLRAHPDIDLTNYAFGKWYHRKIPITTLRAGTVNASSIGQNITQFVVGAESDSLGTAITARIKNICITDGKGNNVYNTQNFMGIF